MSKTKISSRGQTVIPSAIRDRYGLKEGNRLEWIPWNEEAVIVRKVTKRTKPSWSQWVKTNYGLHKEIWNNVNPVDYVKELRSEI